jgi:tetratricopeptide (TPR) repeat protein
MPSQDTTDISHEQRTDHNIQARPSSLAAFQLADLDNSNELVPVGGISAGDRELGLAYAQLAEHGDQQAGEKAFSLLRKAEAGGANDLQVHTQLGFLEQMSGDRAAAAKEYAAALSQDPYDEIAMGNLAVLDAASGRTSDAASLLQRVIDGDPNQLAAGLDLAFIECRMNEKGEALKVLATLSRLNPDDPGLRKFEASGSYGRQRCDLH